MLKTRVCDFSDLQTTLHDYINAAIRPDDPIQYCVEAFENRNGEPPHYYAYVLTKSRLIWASDAPVGSVRQYVEIDNITVMLTMKGDMYYVNVRYNALTGMAQDMFHFESEEKADAFAKLIKRIGNFIPGQSQR